jgi:AraC-like DNA-binding protein
MVTIAKEVAPSVPPSTDKGFFRSSLAGRGGSLRDAFSLLRMSQRVSRLCEYPERGLFGGRIETDREEGEGYCDFLQMGDSLYVVIENVRYNEPRLEIVPGDGLLSFHVRLAGGFTICAGRASPVHIQGPSLLVWLQPDGIEASEWQVPGRHEISVTLYCRPEFVSGLVPETGTMPQHIRRFLACDTGTVNYCHLPVDAEILGTASRIVRSDYTGRMHLVHMEAKVLELFCQILRAFDRLSEALDEQYSARDLERLHRAREILASRFKPVPTIRCIARELGINESKLKRGFKTLFGKTVFEYGHECRMQHALQLLRDQHLRIALVAEASGYMHQTTFASAFKQHFGYRPKEIRRLMLLGREPMPVARNPQTETGLP